MLKGTAKYFGATSGAEWVIPLEDDTAQQGYACLPVTVKEKSNVFKNTSDLDLINGAFPSPMDGDILDIPALRKLIISELPPRDKAVSLINTYYSRVAWQYVRIHILQMLADIR